MTTTSAPTNTELIMNAPQDRTIAPGIRVKDMQKSLEFYATTLGFRITGAITRKDGRIDRAFVGLDSPLLILSPAENVRKLQTRDDLARNKRGVGVEFCIGMTGGKTLDAFFTEVKAKGTTVVSEPETGSWGDRIFTVKDPDGYSLTFFEHIDGIVPEGTGITYACGQHVSGRGRQIFAPGQAIPWRNDCLVNKGIIVMLPAVKSGPYTVLDEETFILVEVKEEHLELLS